jgi:hypothetical protein
MDMITRLIGSLCRALPMATLFVAAFATTWLLQPRAPKAAAAQVMPGEGVSEVNWKVDPEADNYTPTTEYVPTLAVLTLDPDPDTQSEARTLTGLLDAEGRSEN